ncbi:zinc finger protein 513-like [Varroa destructor]|uniref:C2H2-type domain-containing protein n=1 Tax=Varroa destructor TaxID=109461 RepID=A0A7M7KD07_VARDE|nr:zinc finger protein 513-like [Varroa destructor]
MFRCDSCSYSSYRLHHLKRHRLTHSGEKPFSCERCPFTSARLDALQAHRRSHAKHDPLACGVCAFAASNAEALKAHLKLHHYACQNCDLVAPTFKALRVHQRAHNVHRCSQCAFSSLLAVRVEAHERSVHGSGSFTPVAPINSTKMTKPLSIKVIPPGIIAND